MLTERLSQRTPLTILTTGCLVGMYYLYGFVIGPLAEPPQIDVTPSKIGSIPTTTSESHPFAEYAEKYLPDHEWAAAAPYQIKTESAYFFYDSWQREETADSSANGTALDESDDAEVGDTLRFEPFAMIWMPEGRDADEPPITIVSETLFLRFSSKVNFDTPQLGRIVQGALQGKVQIRGPNNLHVVGRNFNFSEKDMQIYCDNHVEFAYDRHFGTAQGLEMKLTRKEHVGENDSTVVGGVESVLLRRNVDLRLTMESDDVAANAASGRAAGGDPVRVTVQSAGSFRYTMATNIATFQENVNVVRPDPDKPGKFDRLRSCDVLTLLFEENPSDEAGDDAADAAATAEKSGGFGGSETDLSFRRLTASGRQLELISEGSGLRAKANHIDYDARQKAAAMTHREAVSIAQDAAELNCPEIRFEHNDDGDLTHILCLGAGWMKQHNTDTGEIEFSARWKKELRKYPEKGTRFDIIRLTQQALVQQPAQNAGLAAEVIMLWVDPEKQPRAVSSSATQDESENNFRLDRMFAETNVAIVTPQFSGEHDRLEAWFEQSRGPAIPESIPAGQVSRRRRNGLMQTAYRDDGPPRLTVAADSAPNQQGLSPPKYNFPFDDVQQHTGEATGDESAPVESFDVKSDLVRLRIVQGAEPRDAQVAEIWTEGSVRVEQKRMDGGGSLEVRGDQMHYQSRTADEEVLKIYGTPSASIRDQDMRIEGPEITFDRLNNFAHVTGAGLLSVPVTRGPNGETLNQPRNLDVTWKERMEFDGKKAEFFGQVVSLIDHSRMSSEEMEVQLTKRLLFSENVREDQDVDVEQIICREGVLFESKDYKEGEVTAIHKAMVPEFTLDNQTGKTFAQGPGRVMSWRIGGTNSGNFAPSATAKSNQPLESDKAAWEFISIDFSGEMVGNTNNRSTEFRDDVKVLYSPVDRPLVEVDPDEFPDDAGRLDCQMLRVNQQQAPDSDETYIQLYGTGNAMLEGRSFWGRADEITYDESKGFYMLKALGDRNATIWRQKTIGDNRSAIDSKWISYNPATGDLKFDRVRSLDGIP